MLIFLIQVLNSDWKADNKIEIITIHPIFELMVTKKGVDISAFNRYN